MSKNLTNDQLRAIEAFRAVQHFNRTELEDYTIAVNAFGPNIMRSGLTSAAAFLLRTKSTASGALGPDLAKALGVTNITTNQQFFDWVRDLEHVEYRRRTRETLRVVHWFKRACQA